MSTPKQIYIEFGMASKTWRFLATLPSPLHSSCVYFSVDEDTPVGEVMDFLADLT